MNRKLISKQCIIDSLKTNYNIETSVLTDVAGGADLHSKVYKAEAVDGALYFVKIKQGLHCEAGVLLQLLLCYAGIQGIISPVKTIDDKLFQPVCNSILTIYSFVNGENGFDRNLNKGQWIEFGKVLKQIHEFNLSQSVQNNIRHENYSSKWRDELRLIYESIEAEVSSDHVDTATFCFMKKHKETILRLVSMADELCKRIKSKKIDFVICHSDIHAGNLLIQDDGKMFIVDWDSPVMAPKERDLMFIGGGVGNAWNNPDEVESFYLGYGMTIIDKEVLYYYRCDRIIEDIVVYYQDLVSSSSENKVEVYKFLVDIFNPKGVVDIALEYESFL